MVVRRPAGRLTSVSSGSTQPQPHPQGDPGSPGSASFAVPTSYSHPSTYLTGPPGPKQLWALTAGPHLALTGPRWVVRAHVGPSRAGLSVSRGCCDHGHKLGANRAQTFSVWRPEAGGQGVPGPQPLRRLSGRVLPASSSSRGLQASVAVATSLQSLPLAPPPCVSVFLLF